MRNPAFCICENKGADKMRGSRVADQRLCNVLLLLLLLYLNAKVFQPFYIRVFFSMVHVRIFI